MTELDSAALASGTPPASSSTGAARSLRIAGRAALVAALVWLVEPLVFVSILFNPANMDPDQTLADWRAGYIPFGYAAGIAAIVFGAALAVMILGVDDVRSARGSRGYAVRLARGAGLLGAAAMVVAGAIDLTENGLAGMALTMLPDVSEGARWLAHQAVAITHEGLRLTACVGFATWLVVLARTGRRAGVIGRAIAITVVIAAFFIVVPGAVTGLLTGMNFVLLALIPLAVGLLRRASRAERA